MPVRAWYAIAIERVFLQTPLPGPQKIAVRPASPDRPFSTHRSKQSSNVLTQYLIFTASQQHFSTNLASFRHAILHRSSTQRYHQRS
jgi:hypothetical protein